eukprot:2450550-Alexandrium_andersonii.AAC.1
MHSPHWGRKDAQTTSAPSTASLCSQSPALRPLDPDVNGMPIRTGDLHIIGTLATRTKLYFK